MTSSYGSLALALQTHTRPALFITGSPANPLSWPFGSCDLIQDLEAVFILVLFLLVSQVIYLVVIMTVYSFSILLSYDHLLASLAFIQMTLLLNC